MKYLGPSVFAAILLGCCCGLARGQTIWTQPGSGDWFEPENWTRGVPNEDVAAVIGEGLAQAFGQRRAPVSAGGLTIGQDSPNSNREAKGSLDVSGLDVRVRGNLIVGESRGQPVSGVLNVNEDGTLGGNVLVTESVIAGWVESGKSASTAVAKISGDLLVEADQAPTRQPVDLVLGLNRGVGLADGAMAVEGSVAGFDNVIIGWNDESDLGTASGSLRASQLKSAAESSELAVGWNTGRGGLAQGQLHVVGGGIEGFERIRIGHAEGSGQANGTLRLQDGHLGASLVQIGQLQDLPGARARSRGVLQLEGVSLLESSVEVGTGGQLLAQGKITGTITNAGIVDVLSGTQENVLSVNGDYRQLASGELRLDIDGPRRGVDYDVMTIGGAGELDGRLHLSFGEQAKLVAGQRFDVLTAKQLTGQWQVSVENPPSDLAFKFDQANDQFSFEMVKPAPHAYRNPLGEQALWSDPGVWAGDQIPDSTNQVTLENRNNQPQQLLIGGDVLVRDLSIAGPVQPMNLLVSPGARFATTHDVTIQQGGMVTLDRGMIAAESLNVLPGGHFTGRGTYAGDIVNQGRMLVGSFDEVSSLSIEGDFAQLEHGLVDFDIAGLGAGEFDSLAISGQATLGGRLSIRLADNLQLESGVRIPLLVAEEGILGEFRLVDLPVLEDFEIGVEFGATSVVLFMQMLTSSDRGDMDRNDVINQCDIDDFALALGDPDAYFDVYHFSPAGRGNVNLDGEFDFDDIDPFLELASDVPCDTAAATVPEPGGMPLAFAAMSMALVFYRNR